MLVIVVVFERFLVFWSLQDSRIRGSRNELSSPTLGYHLECQASISNTILSFNTPSFRHLQTLPVVELSYDERVQQYTLKTSVIG
jgi:hypothetical protein